jgi:nucleotide-binding universal stress UspA family protein
VFKHLLVPTDRSPLSEEAIHMAVGLAKQFEAKITGIHVIPEFHLLTYDTEAQYSQHAKHHAEQYLAFIERVAMDAAVLCDSTSVVSDHPYDAVINTAQDRHCDLIAMASHGRRGMRALLLGSETQKVLMHSQIPVLVVRQQAQAMRA